MIKLCLFMLCSTAALCADFPFAQISSNKDQITDAKTQNTSLVITLENVDALSQMAWDPTKDTLTIQEAGVYLITAVAQAGAREYANLIKGGDIVLWLELNQKPVKNSGYWSFISPTSRSKTLVSEVVMPLNAGDSLQLKYYANAPSLGILAFPIGEDWPASPGIELTVYKVGEQPAASAKQ
jgi:hypothetical protein